MSPQPPVLMHPHPSSSVCDLLFPKQNSIEMKPDVSFPMNLALMTSVGHQINQLKSLHLCDLTLGVSPPASCHKTPNSQSLPPAHLKGGLCRGASRQQVKSPHSQRQELLVTVSS